jgi:hypothetical protein
VPIAAHVPVGAHSALVSRRVALPIRRGGCFGRRHKVDAWPDPHAPGGRQRVALHLTAAASLAVANVRAMPSNARDANRERTWRLNDSVIGAVAAGSADQDRDDQA